MTPARSGPDGPLQSALQQATTAANTRATEGQKIFSPIAAFLDRHRSQTSGLPPHLQKALASLSDDLAAVAQHHFSAYICGLAPEDLSRPSLSTTRPPSGLAQATYAAAAASSPAPKSTP
jgi:hypothetical protein